MRAYKNVIQAIPDASLVADINLRITGVNEAFVDLFGYRLEDVIGQTPEILEASYAAPSGFWQPFKNLTTDSAEKAFIQYRKKSGDELGCLSRKVLLTGADEQHVGYLGILTPEEYKSSDMGHRQDTSKSIQTLRQASVRKDLIPLLMENLFQAIGIEGALLVLIQSDTNKLDVVFPWGVWNGWTESEQERIASISKKTSSQGREWVWSAEASYSESITLFEGLKGVICWPLPFMEELRGVLWLGRSQIFKPDEMEMISLTAELAVLELIKSRFHDHAARQSRRMAAFRRIDLAIKESMDLRVALGVILDQIISHLEVDAADVLVLHPDSVMLEAVAQRGFRNKRFHTKRIRLGQSVPGKIGLDKRAKLIPNLGNPEMGSPWENLLIDRGFVGYYGVPLVARGSIKGVLEIYSHGSLYPDLEWERFLETLAGQAAIAIDKTELFENWQRSEAALDMSNDSTLMTLSKALSLRDDQTEIFNQQMIDQTLQLARSMGVLEEGLTHIRRGVILHDIGKLGIPDEILFKSGPLNDDEWAIMRRHPEFAVEILSPNPQLASAMDIPYCHHERWDGAGYPRGLKEEEIPLAARIFAVIDVWTAMTSLRPYRPPHSEEVTREFIQGGSGSQFDPQVVETFMLTT